MVWGRFVVVLTWCVFGAKWCCSLCGVWDVFGGKMGVTCMFYYFGVSMVFFLEFFKGNYAGVSMVLDLRQGGIVEIDKFLTKKLCCFLVRA